MKSIWKGQLSNPSTKLRIMHHCAFSEALTAPSTSPRIHFVLTCEPKIKPATAIGRQQQSSIAIFQPI